MFFVRKKLISLYLLMYLQKFFLISFRFFIFSRFPVFSRFLGLFIDLPFVYTSILEQKRIEGQAQNLIILILFLKKLILLAKP